MRSENEVSVYLAGLFRTGWDFDQVCKHTCPDKDEDFFKGFVLLVESIRNMKPGDSISLETMEFGWGDGIRTVSSSEVFRHDEDTIFMDWGNCAERCTCSFPEESHYSVIREENN